MPTSDSRRQRQQLMTCGERQALPLLDELADEAMEDVESEELVEDMLLRDCRGSAAGRLAALVCSWSRREASPGEDIDSVGVDGLGRTARSGL